MPVFETKRRVPYTARQMFAIAADVEHYPEFLPLCTGLKVLSRRPTEQGEVLDAVMSVGYKTIAEKFTTRVTLKPATTAIDVAYLDGPFRRLENRWLFVDLPAGGSEVDFYISYEFRSVLLGALVGGVFDAAFRKFAEAFETRARHVYGAPANQERP